MADSRSAFDGPDFFGGDLAFLAREVRVGGGAVLAVAWKGKVQSRMGFVAARTET